jgi:hypothetical protein
MMRIAITRITMPRIPTAVIPVAYGTIITVKLCRNTVA